MNLAILTEFRGSTTLFLRIVKFEPARASTGKFHAPSHSRARSAISPTETSIFTVLKCATTRMAALRTERFRYTAHSDCSASVSDAEAWRFTETPYSSVVSAESDPAHRSFASPASALQHRERQESFHCLLQRRKSPGQTVQRSNRIPARRIRWMYQ